MPKDVVETTVLLVEAAVHERNGREIPLPSVIPFKVDLGWNRPLKSSDIWFRAEVAPEGSVDNITLLEKMAQPWEEHVMETIQQHLRLQYADERRHRTVVFGVATIDEQGLMTVRDNGLVTIPQCCCGAEICI